MSEYVLEEMNQARTKLGIGARVRRFLMSHFAYFRKKCPFDSTHWISDRLCTCGLGDHGKEVDGYEWHGGICDLENSYELQLCGACDPSSSKETHQWALTEEEEVILTQWRAYRESFLSYLDEEIGPYKYEIQVHQNDTVYSILTRTVGAAALNEPAHPELAVEKKFLPN